MITVYTGLPGSGKTATMAGVALRKLRDAEALKRKYGYVRKVYSNILFSPPIFEKYSEFIVYFTDIYDIHKWRDCDIFIDELAMYFDAHDWERLPAQVKGFLRLHRHYNVNIHAVSQDFLAVDKTFRRLVANLYYIYRLVGTREPSPHLPPIKRPFLFGRICLVDEKTYDEEKEHYRFVTAYFNFVTGKTFRVFDTTQELPEQPLPPLIKRVRYFHGDEETPPFKKVKYE